MVALLSSIMEFALSKLGTQIEPTPTSTPETKPTFTITIDQSDELYNASRSHLSDCLLQEGGPTEFYAELCPVDHNIYFFLDDNQIYKDQFEGITITWIFRLKSYQVSFCAEHYHQVVHSYFPYISNKFKTMLRNSKKILHTVFKLFTDDYGKLRWGDGLVHASCTTFDNLIIDSEIKKIVVDDLDRLIAGEVGKRGYLLFGPPKISDGRSQFMSAMSNYLGYFNIYSFEIDLFRDDDDFKILMATSKKSILFCKQIHRSNESKMSLLRFLKFLDGLSPSCLEERIIVLTTGHKDEIDQSLFLPGGVERHVRNTFYAPIFYKLKK